MFYFDEPRLSAMLKVQGNNVVIEQRKEKTQNTETDIKEKVQKYLQHADKQTENDVRKLLNNYFDGKYKNI